MNDVGCPMMPELVGYSHNTLPVEASNARNSRSFVPPLNTSPPPVVSIGPQFAEDVNVCVQTRAPVSTCQACTSPICVAPGAMYKVLLIPVKARPAVYVTGRPIIV